MICKDCSAICCRTLQVEVTYNDICRIEKYLGIPREDIVDENNSLIRQNGYCTFLDSNSNKCLVQRVKPMSCIHYHCESHDVLINSKKV